VDSPSVATGYQLGRHRVPSDGSPTQTASLPPWSSQRTSGAQSARQGHSLPSSTDYGGDFTADSVRSHVGASKRSGSLFAPAVVASPSGDNGSQVGRCHAPSDGLPTQTASSPPWSSQRTSGAQSARRGHSLPPSTDYGGDFTADSVQSHVGASERSGSSFAPAVVASPPGDSGSRVGRCHDPLDGLPTQTASSPPWSSQST
jgi:hypothetical protein